MPVKCPACKWLCVPSPLPPYPFKVHLACSLLCPGPFLFDFTAQGPRSVSASVLSAVRGLGLGWVFLFCTCLSVALACCTSVCAASALHSRPFPNPSVVRLFFARLRSPLHRLRAWAPVLCFAGFFGVGVLLRVWVAVVSRLSCCDCFLPAAQVPAFAFAVMFWSRPEFARLPQARRHV